jgi:hypothetical protein
VGQVVGVSRVDPEGEAVVLTLAPDDPRHGTPSGYRSGCRCDRCRAAIAEYQRTRPHDALATDDPRHGTVNAYTNHKCRCDRCRAAWAAEFKRLRANRAARLAVDPTLAPHGSPTTYANWRCRCAACSAAHAAMHRELRQRNQGAA